MAVAGRRANRYVYYVYYPFVFSDKPRRVHSKLFSRFLLLAWFIFHHLFSLVSYHRRNFALSILLSVPPPHPTPARPPGSSTSDVKNKSSSSRSATRLSVSSRLSARSATVLPLCLQQKYGRRHQWDLANWHIITPAIIVTMNISSQILKPRCEWSRKEHYYEKYC
jgi:hypothetical protein